MAPPSPVLIGVVGDSGSGKTTLSSCIAHAVGTERATLICLDDYHRYDRTERERRGITALDPECNRLDLVAEHLAALRAGSAITKPVYDHHDGTFGPDEVVEPREIIVVRGLLGLHTEALTRCFDLSVFLDPDPDLRVRWKVERDCAKRGYSRGEVLEQIAQRRPDADRFIAPQRHRADLVIRFAPGTNRAGGARRNGRGIFTRPRGHQFPRGPRTSTLSPPERDDGLLAGNPHQIVLQRGGRRDAGDQSDVIGPRLWPVTTGTGQVAG